MKINKTILCCFSLGLLFNSCENATSNLKTDKPNPSIKKDTAKLNLLTDYIPLYEDGDVNAVIEIPAGSVDKWELNKDNGLLEWELVNDTPRVVDYLGYPGNYGMIPRTLLSKESGGDGDPLDIIVLGQSVDRGSVIKCKLIGVLYLKDREEQDDKLIAVSSASSLYGVNSIDELNTKYKGISEIVELWFTNYKEPNKMKSNGYGSKEKALEILKEAIAEYEENNKVH